MISDEFSRNALFRERRVVVEVTNVGIVGTIKYTC